MTHSGMISKMGTQINTPVQYHLQLADDCIDMNSLLGNEILLTWLHQIKCMCCGKIIPKSFAQGYCFPCFMSIPETEECVLNPQLCKAHEGIARNMEWAREHCLQDHYVYLALSSEVKVGVTRQSQIPTRWIDQGATRAIKLARTPNRHLAGVIEVELKKHLTDKTNWRSMLMNKIADHVLLDDEKKRISSVLPEELQSYVCTEDTIVSLVYPYLSIPEKVTSISFEKQPTLKGILNGIKGQYLIFDKGNVINLRKYGGYMIELSY